MGIADFLFEIGRNRARYRDNVLELRCSSPVLLGFGSHISKRQFGGPDSNESGAMPIGLQLPQTNRVQSAVE